MSFWSDNIPSSVYTRNDGALDETDIPLDLKLMVPSEWY
jgi:hypothetical protein